MLSSEWPAALPVPLDAVVSALSIHHLPDARKRTHLPRDPPAAQAGRLVHQLRPRPRAGRQPRGDLGARQRSLRSAGAVKRTNRTAQEQARYENHVRYMIPLAAAAGLARAGRLRRYRRLLETAGLGHLRRPQPRPTPDQRDGRRGQGRSMARARRRAAVEVQAGADGRRRVRLMMPRPGGLADSGGSKPRPSSAIAHATPPPGVYASSKRDLLRLSVLDDVVERFLGNAIQRQLDVRGERLAGWPSTVDARPRSGSDPWPPPRAGAAGFEPELGQALRAAARPAASASQPSRRASSAAALRDARPPLAGWSSTLSAEPRRSAPPKTASGSPRRAAHAPVAGAPRAPPRAAPVRAAARSGWPAPPGWRRSAPARPRRR